MSASRAVVLRLARHMRGGVLTIDERGRRYQLGDGAGELRATVWVRDPRAWRAALHGGLGLGDSYADGLWDCDDLVALMRLCARSIGPLDRARSRFATPLAPFQDLRTSARRNSPMRARRNARAHYDIGNELYELFLDETMTYSSAIFDRPGMSLRDAQLAKLDRACRRLALGPRDHVVEVGSGWGSLAIHAASRYGAHVTTTTLSPRQREFARRRVAAAGLDGRVEVLLRDYRELEGRYTHLISLEMIEAVGWRDIGTYLRRCSELLDRRGAALIQAILIDDRLYEGEKRSRSFANTRVFPGGCLPSLTSLASSSARHTDLRLAGFDDITPHYAETLRIWRERFLAARERAGELGYDERFQRLWEMYLAFSEAGFRERRLRVAQLLLARPGWRGEANTSAASAPDQAVSVPQAA